MLYPSPLLGKPVTDVEGNRVGWLEDLIASPRGAMPHPMIAALAVRNPKGPCLVPISAVAALFAPAIPLRQRLQDIPSYVPSERELDLARDVLDKQIIDTNRARMVRVNDRRLMGRFVNGWVINTFSWASVGLVVLLTVILVVLSPFLPTPGA